MLRSLKAMEGFSLEALDGAIGKVNDFLFDDQKWGIRYLTADTGGWLTGRQVLLSPSSFRGRPDWKHGKFPVALTRDEIKKSPPLDSHLPVSRKKELELIQYYQWPIYWHTYLQDDPSNVIVPEVRPVPVNEEDKLDEKELHLRSAHEVRGYHISASDGQVGHVEDLIGDDDRWQIRYIIIRTGHLLSGKSVLIDPARVESVLWEEKRVILDLTCEHIEQSPQYDPAQAGKS